MSQINKYGYNPLIRIPSVWLLLVLIVSNSCQNKREAIQPEYRELTESVYASVIVQPDSLYQVYAIVSGILDKNLIEEGDPVVKGQNIIQVINNTPKLNTENAKLQLQLAQENYSGRAAILNSIEDEILSATLKYKNDSTTFFRQKNLWNQQIGSKAEYDAKKLNYELSKNNLQLIRSRYQRTQSELLTALKQAKNNLATTQIASEDFTISSKINGNVYALYKEPGEIVNTMEPLATLGSKNRFIIEMLVDEVDIVKVNVNQLVIITLDAYGDQVFKGRVYRILPKKDEQNQTFTVEALFDHQPTKLYPGLSGEANIIIAKKDSVLTLPISYVRNNQVETESGIKDVETGMQNMEFVEIISGINANTKVYEPDEL
ncbi:efflux RND transporter periplasmic adaptor subunit [Winogradskyella aquimaris]|uniref:HlyD family efflux transporter periplasmic adaptor subunit n=1 Tax=Winogradskyella aquimaris TaxID=864074 RepID=A0ABU5ENR9_9FLAO|nr:HlyD family efflux transporter periplasmic adaptor subunit [Winogradskyella aquimaris]MDY2587923.1 HlyD family efflux transporter periplasmic adaptor subunit [Winogradskyella aquimaris]